MYAFHHGTGWAGRPQVVQVGCSLLSSISYLLLSSISLSSHLTWHLRFCMCLPACMHAACNACMPSLPLPEDLYPHLPNNAMMSLFSSQAINACSLYIWHVHGKGLPLPLPCSLTFVVFLVTTTTAPSCSHFPLSQGRGLSTLMPYASLSISFYLPSCSNFLLFMHKTRTVVSGMLTPGTVRNKKTNPSLSNNIYMASHSLHTCLPSEEGALSPSLFLSS